MQKKIRVFVAIELPIEVKEEIIRIQGNIQQTGLFEGRYIKPDNAHITMKFIGDVDQAEIAHIHAALQTISFSSCTVQLDKVDVFSKGDSIKIIYLNVISPDLVQLALDIDYKLEHWCALEDREFVSHVTLARVKKVEDKKALLDFIHQVEVDPIVFTIDSFVLKESVLTPEGPEYTTLYEYALPAMGKLI